MQKPTVKGICTQTVKLVKPIGPPAETARSKAKLHCHLICIALCGMVTIFLIAQHVNSTILVGLGPQLPMVIQEIIDRLRRL
jgi:hypothetical protein